MDNCLSNPSEQTKIKKMKMKIYIINLKRCEDRLIAMYNERLKLNSNFEFYVFDAIDALNNEHIEYKDKYYSKFTKYILGKDLTDGEIACFASHYCLWMKCVDLNEPIIVLEDDIIIQPHFEEGINNILDTNYRFVKLSSINTDSPNKQKTNRLINKNFILSLNGLDGTQGYYITPKVALIFYRNAKKWYKPVDNYIESFWIHNIPTITYNPRLIIDHPNYTNTTITQRKIKVPFRLKITREISKAILDVRKKLYIFFNNYEKNFI